MPKYKCVVTDGDGKNIDVEETTARDVHEAMQYLFNKHNVGAEGETYKFKTEPADPQQDDETIGLRCMVDDKVFHVAKV